MHGHEGGHHHRHQDLDEVAEEGDRASRPASSPASMRSPPNQTTATLETLRTSITVGNMNAISRPARSDVAVSVVVGHAEALDLLGLADEGPHHPDAGDLLAQHLVDAVDALLHEPELRDHPHDHQPTHDRRAPGWRRPGSARGDRPRAPPGSLPPTIMIGAATNSVQVIRTSICTCCTSLVMRVISDGAPNWPTSRAEKPVTRWKSAAAHVAPEAHRRLGAEVDGPDGEDDLHEGDAEHHRAHARDVAGVARDDALVDDVGVEGRQQQRAHGLHELQAQRRRRAAGGSGNR